MKRHRAIGVAGVMLLLVACKSKGTHGSGGAASSGGAGGGAPVAAEQFCKTLAEISCKADDQCCDGNVSDASPSTSTTGTTSTGTTATGGAPSPYDICVSKQIAACDASAGRLVTDPRTGYDPARGGAFLQKATNLAMGCWKDSLSYADFIGVFGGTGDIGADCTPENMNLATLRIAELSCKGNAACRLNLDANSHPNATCASRADTTCSTPADCPAGQWCDLPSSWSAGTWGTCRPVRAAGWACESDLQCESYFCAPSHTCAAAPERRECLTVLYPTAVKDDSPLAFYRLDNPMMAPDASGNGHDGAVMGTPGSTGGALASDPNTAMSFGGKGDRVVVSGSLGATTAGLTLELWVSTSMSSSGRPIVALGDPTKPAVTVSVASSGDAISVGLVDTAGMNNTLSSMGGSLPKTGWHHVAVTYDGAHARLFIDGAQAASTIAAFTLAPADGLAIGSNAAGDMFFDGNLDEVAVYGAALAPDRIAYHMAIGKNGPYASTWPLFGWLR